MFVKPPSFLLDGMVVDYLADAMDGSYDPAFDHDDNLRPERVAAFRLFLYAGLDIAPTAVEGAARFPRVKNERYELADLFNLPVGLSATVENAAWGAVRTGAEALNVLLQVEAAGEESILSRQE